MSKKILIVDDDSSIAEILEFNLRNEGFEIEIASSAEDALLKNLNNLDLILLDVMMGGMSGYKMAEQIRKADINIPIIFLTAKDTENDMLTGFSVGGDDYISKPFSIKEIIARVKAILKRNDKVSVGNDHKLSYNNFVIDFDLKELYINDTKVELTKTEFNLLYLLAKNPDRMFSRESIINKLWQDSPYITERTVDVHIARLRKKLNDYAFVISNRSGYGYRFNTTGL
ncbi:MAG: response regulator transcription factor [Chitinophagales bacterium]|nr:response regulator transcription factor [Chitinophagales bacterium]